MCCFNHHRHIEEKIINTRNIDAFYKHVNRKLSCKSGVRPIKKPDGTFCIKRSIFLMDTLGVSELTLMMPTKSFPLVCFRTPSSMASPSTLSVFQTLCNLKNRSVAGTDKIKPIFYKKLAAVMSSPLASMCNYTISNYVQSVSLFHIFL